jgi:hypothetical protein
MSQSDSLHEEVAHSRFQNMSEAPVAQKAGPPGRRARRPRARAFGLTAEGVGRLAGAGAEVAGGAPRWLPECWRLWITDSGDYHLTRHPISGAWTLKFGHATLVDIAFTRRFDLDQRPSALQTGRTDIRAITIAESTLPASRLALLVLVPRADQDRRLAPRRKDLPGRRDRPGHPLTAESGTSRRPTRPRVPERPLLVS